MSEYQNYNVCLAVSRIISFGLALVCIGLAAGAYHDDTVFNAWLDTNTNLTGKEREDYRRGESIEELAFIGGMSLLLGIGFIHLSISIYSQAWALSIWSVWFLILTGLLIGGGSGLEFYSVSYYEARIVGQHPCLHHNPDEKKYRRFHFCQETVSKAIAASFAVVIGVIREIQAYVNWRDIVAYRKWRSSVDDGIIVVQDGEDGSSLYEDASADPINVPGNTEC